MKIESLGYRVTKTFAIKEGSRFSISPSQGLAGLSDGAVEVLKVGSEDTINNTTYDFDVWKTEENETVIFVEFKYLNSPEHDVMPLELFVDHISAV